MRDPRIDQLADVLVGYSMDVQPGDNVYLSMRDYDKALTCALIEKVYEKKAFPFVELGDSAINRALYLGMDEELVKRMAEDAVHRMEKMNCQVSFRGGENDMELSDVPSDKLAMYRRLHWKPVHDVSRKNNVRWVVVQFPTAGAAQKANMSTEQFEDFFFDVCCVDYKKMDKAMDPLVELMEKTDKVRIQGEGTDISFSIKGIPAVKCAGRQNIPDGEVFTAPVKESVNGVITFNAPSIEAGTRFENIRLVFKNGKCVEATSNNTKKLNEILDTDEGSRYVGEFSFGLNPSIKIPMCDTLFDEKISGSFHFAMGSSYDDAYNGNESANHWDLVCMQGEGYGGTIEMDGRLVRKDGRFVIPELEALNPENFSK